MRLSSYAWGLLPVVGALPPGSQVVQSPADIPKFPSRLPFDLPLDQGQIVPDRYIVTLKQNAKVPEISGHLGWVSATHRRSLEARGWTADQGQTRQEELTRPGRGRKHKGLEKVWTESFKGYSGEFDQETIQKIAARRDVLSIERVKLVKQYATVTQSGIVPWGLGSISHRTPVFDKYLYDSSAADGTWAYIIDSGLYTEHIEFQGRAFLGYNALAKSGVAFNDTDGHGTHVAGTVGSRAYGVAKKANLMSVKVFSGGATGLDVVLDGYEWAVKNITGTPGRASKAVVSMSLGARGTSYAFSEAIATAYRSGVLTVVAAGNDGSEARMYTPASAPQAITVGAITKSYSPASFSDYGTAVDLWAAGTDVRSTWIGGPDKNTWLSGTSMATPYIAGLALYLMGKENATLTSPGAVTSRIIELGTKGVLKELKPGSPDVLAYNGIA